MKVYMGKAKFIRFVCLALLCCGCFIKGKTQCTVYYDMIITPAHAAPYYAGESLYVEIEVPAAPIDWGNYLEFYDQNWNPVYQNYNTITGTKFSITVDPATAPASVRFFTTSGCQSLYYPIQFELSPAIIISQLSAFECGDGVARVDLDIMGGLSSDMWFQAYESDPQNPYYSPTWGSAPGSGHINILNYNPQFQYAVKLVYNNGMNETDFYPIFIDNTHPVIPVISGPSSFCAGSQAIFTGSGSNGLYHWRFNDVDYYSSGTFEVPASTLPGTYTLYASGLSYNSCESAISSVSFTISGTAVKTSITASKNVIYKGQSVKISSYGGEGTRYYRCSNNGGNSWTVFNEAYEGQQSFVHRPPDYGDYIYQVRTIGGPCENTAYTDGVTVKVRHEPTEPRNDNNKTWITTKTFHKDSTVKAISTQYFDQTGKATQSQTYNISRSMVLGSETINDSYGRPAITSLPAFMGFQYFEYRNGFTSTTSGTAYNHQNFDGAKTNDPDPVGNNASGTLGWYYSANNSIEERVPVSAYPYSRTDFYKDGTGNAKRTAGVGEAYRMGQNREVSSYITPVQNELDHYLQMRNKYFTEAELGAMPATLAGKAFQSIAKDVNGKEVVSITDKDGKTLMSAIPGNELSVTNTVSMGGVYEYIYYFPQSYEGNNLRDVSVTGGYIYMYQNTQGNNNGPWTLIYNGTAAGLINMGPMNIPKTYAIKIESGEPFTVSYNAAGTSTINICSNCASTFTNKEVQSVYYFKLFKNEQVSVTSANGIQDYILYDMATEAQVAGFSGNAVLPPGYYKLVNHNNANLLTLSYSNSYSDISYIFYNQLGQAVATIDPEGVSRLLQTPNAYVTKSSIPFISTSEYNLRGQLVAATGVDGGRAEFIYRRDGKLRFSQNAKQREYGWFSYTNYDRWGRAVESGEYHPNGDVTFEGLKTNTVILENKTLQGGLSAGTKVDWTRTAYDTEDNTHGQPGYAQTFVRGGVSTTVGPAGKTWYSYDEQGRSTFTIKAVYGMSNGATKYFTEDYVYDSEGNMVKSIFQKNVPAETFIHYYRYDADERLARVYTNTTDNDSTWMLQAGYEYFLHGPVKRVEIAGNLQGIDYTYTLDGKLKAINHSKKAMDPGKDGMAGAHAGFLPDAFGEVLEYYDNDYTSNTLIGSSSSGSSGEAVFANLQVNSHGPQTTMYKATNSITFKDGFSSNGASFTTQLGAPASGGSEDPATPSQNISVAINNNDALPQYGGQIRGMSWFSKKPPMAGVPETPNMYAYKYDDKYRFNTATWGGISNNTFTPQAGVNKETVPLNTGYDKHGNLQYLGRTNTAGATVDDFKYNYYPNTNKLQSITQQTTGQVYATYQYDSLGQLTAEMPGPAYGSAPAKYINYNVEGLVTGVFSDVDTIHPLVRYVYDEMGSRIKKVSYNSSGQVIKTTWYIGGVIYEQELGQSVPLQTEVAIDGGGRVGVYFRQGNAYRYEMTDHLGNVRAVFVKTSSGGTDMVVFRDYYPFGMEIAGRSYTDADGYRYGYQGKYAEKDPETGWNAFELRMYDSRIGRWLSVDPEGQYYSPYVGMGNDPVNRTDLTGGTDDYYENENGDVKWFNNTAKEIVDKNGATWKNIGKSYTAFDGRILSLHYQVTDENGGISPKLFLVPAVSGRPNKDGLFDYSKVRQAMGDVGPLPEGKYSIDPNAFRELSFKDDLVGGGLAITQLFGKKFGAFPGGHYSWGAGRIPISPASVQVLNPLTNKVVTRTSFTIHGGSDPGSAGCIDLMRSDLYFFNKLREVSGVPIILMVNYSNVKAVPIKSPFNSDGTGFKWQKPIIK